VIARHSGLEVRRITPLLLGGVSELGTQPPRAAVELRVALGGPRVSVALGAVPAGWVLSAPGAPALTTATLSWLAMMNVVLGVFMPHGRRATRAATGL
jgi:Zn-dependent protease